MSVVGKICIYISMKEELDTAFRPNKERNIPILKYGYSVRKTNMV